MTATVAGFREVEHTADWELAVWAPDLAGLLEQAARGMLALAGVVLADGPRTERRVRIAAADPEGLLVGFLEELLYLGEADGLAFDRFDIQIFEGAVEARVEGAPIARQVREIKAVTWHNLAVREGPRGLETSLVLDV
jgi:SHS2 domain-containing protein